MRRRATATAVLDEGRTGPLPLRPLEWLAGFASPREVDLRHEVDVEVARATVQALQGDDLLALATWLEGLR